jgi:tetratricopeptide (TPR) repeat protein
MERLVGSPWSEDCRSFDQGVSPLSSLVTSPSGLELASDDRYLISCRGEVKAGRGDPDGALADWRRALELDTEDISPLYSSAFVLELEGRLEEAAKVPSVATPRFSSSCGIFAGSG